jgi:hypothetical protein
MVVRRARREAIAWSSLYGANDLSLRTGEYGLIGRVQKRSAAIWADGKGIFLR